MGPRARIEIPSVECDRARPTGERTDRNRQRMAEGLREIVEMKIRPAEREAARRPDRPIGVKGTGSRLDVALQRHGGRGERACDVNAGGQAPREASVANTRKTCGLREIDRRAEVQRRGGL